MSEKPYKISGWYDAYKTIRKPMPRPGYFEEDKRPDSTFEEDEVSIEDLKKEAEIICEGRGHILNEWIDAKRGTGYISTSSCKKCNKRITVIERPVGNGRDMVGEAFTQDCIN